MTAAYDLQLIVRAIDDERAPERRGELALRIADLFETGSERYAEEQIQLFDTVFERLIERIEESARATLAERFAPLPNAPLKLVERLSMDTSIDVAGPILSQSPRLSLDALVAAASSGDQARLLAIAERAFIAEPITDIIVRRGSTPVLERVAGNGGARFSPDGMSALVDRAAGNDQLAITLGARKDLSQALLQKLIASASIVARQRLEAGSQHAATDIRSVVNQITERMARQAADEARDYGPALAEVRALHQDNALGDTQVRSFAEHGQIEHVVASLIVLGNLPVRTVESALHQDRPEGILILARAIGMSWATARAILRARAGSRNVSSQLLEQAAFSYERLKPETATLALQLQRRKFEQQAQ